MGTSPPFAGEGEHALWHFSEDPNLEHFEPHVAQTSSTDVPYVWAIETRASPHYWFPRDCPRGCVWVTPRTTADDRARFFGHSTALRLHVSELVWAERMATCVLYAYRMPPETFEHSGDEAAGFWMSREPVDAIERVEVGNLLDRHAKAGIELRFTPDLWPFWHAVRASTLGFSGTRLRNAARPEPPND